eukprot:sb/3479770/
MVGLTTEILSNKESFNLNKINLPFLRNASVAEDLTCSIAQVEGAKVGCSGVSACLTDECGCVDGGEPLFYCPGLLNKGEDSTSPGGKGCIPFVQVCDGVPNCDGGLDECLCSNTGTVEITCLSDRSFNTCLSVRHACNVQFELGVLGCTGFNGTEENCTAVQPIQTVGMELKKYQEKIVKYVERYPVQTHCYDIIEREITGDITPWAEDLCDRLKVVLNQGFGSYIIFYCHPESDILENVIDNLGYICDGKPDCNNGHDEKFCPNRFYCSTDDGEISWVGEEEVCDGTPNCDNGMDECTGCDIGVLSSSEFLIRNNILTGLALIGGLSIVVLNVKIGYNTYKESTETKNARIDRVFRMQIAGYDCLMGLYLVLLVGAAVVLRVQGDYCQQDGNWRSSYMCITLGCTFSISTHGSFLLITAMSVVRFLKCLNIVEEIPVRVIWVATTIIGLLNLTHALIPVIPLWQIKEFFRTNIILTKAPDNPFLSRFDQPHLERMHSLIYNSTPGEQGMESVLEDLRNITSNPSIFDYVPIGYYGSSPLCVANIFKNQPSYLSYKIGYGITITVCLISLLCVVYLAILVASHVTSERAGKAQNSSDNVRKLAMKVSLLIGSDVVSWMPYLLYLVYYTWLEPRCPPGIVQELFSLVVLPSNSLLNPIFYSAIYKGVVEFLSKCWGRGKDPDNGNAVGGAAVTQ